MASRGSNSETHERLLYLNVGVQTEASFEERATQERMS